MLFFCIVQSNLKYHISASIMIKFKTRLICEIYTYYIHMYGVHASVPARTVETCLQLHPTSGGMEQVSVWGGCVQVTSATPAWYLELSTAVCLVAVDETGAEGSRGRGSRCGGLWACSSSQTGNQISLACLQQNLQHWNARDSGVSALPISPVKVWLVLHNQTAWLCKTTVRLFPTAGQPKVSYHITSANQNQQK